MIFLLFWTLNLKTSISESQCHQSKTGCAMIALVMWLRGTCLVPRSWSSLGSLASKFDYGSYFPLAIDITNDGKILTVDSRHLHDRRGLARVRSLVCSSLCIDYRGRISNLRSQNQILVRIWKVNCTTGIVDFSDQTFRFRPQIPDPITSDADSKFWQLMTFWFWDRSF